MSKDVNIAGSSLENFCTYELSKVILEETMLIQLCKTTWKFFTDGLITIFMLVLFQLQHRC